MRPQVREFGALAIGLMFVITVVLAALVSTGGVPHATLASSLGANAGESAIGAKTVSSSVVTKSSSPAATGAATTATVAYGTPFTAYTLLPDAVGAVITVTGASINVSTTKIWMTFFDKINGAQCSLISDNGTVADGKTSYSFLLDPVLLLGGACRGIQTDPVNISTTLVVVGASNTVTTWANATTSLIFAPLSVKLVSPSGAVGIGNATFVATYTAQYLISVNLLVWNPAKTQVLENASLIWPSANVPAFATWYAPAVGNYPYNLTAVTSYGTATTSGMVVVLSNGGGTVYLNNSNFHNATLLPGISGAVAGTILLVVGLILGMIVALALASLMRPSPAASPQAWQPKTTAPNTCSTCGKSFDSADELSAHAKSEHGMS